MSDTIKVVVGVVSAIVALAGIAAAAYFVIKKVMSKYDCCEECILDCCDCEEFDDEEIVEDLAEEATED